MRDVAEVLPTLLARRAANEGDRPFLIDVEHGTLTYREVHERSLRWAGLLQGLGVGEGDTVLVMLPTSFDAVTAWLGVGYLGGLEVPINSAYLGQMLAHIVRDSEASVIVVHAQWVDRLEAVVGEVGDALRTVVVVGGEAPASAAGWTTVSAADALEAATPPVDLPERGWHDVAAILYTSGTTGPSKGVIVPWGQLHATAVGGAPPGGFADDDRYYAPLPMFHVSGKMVIYALALSGGGVVIRERFDTESFWPDIAAHDCTATALIGAMANFLYRAPAQPEDADTPLRYVFMVPLIPEWEDFCKRFGVKLFTVFNMTEISCPLFAEAEQLASYQSCGLVRPGYQVRVVDEHDNEVPPGTLGELVVRSDEPWTLMAGYWRRPEATVQAWRNQWLHTGDGFIRDENDNYFFVDRMKDAIRRRGENISSMEVEAEVNSHPGVLESAAIAVPSEWGEDEVKIVVVRKPDATVTEAELIEYLTPRMPHFMLPRFVEFVAELPKTPTQKVKKAELRAAGITDSTWSRASSKG